MTATYNQVQYPSTLIFSVELVGPEQAAALLTANTGNRRVRKKKIHQMELGGK